MRGLAKRLSREKILESVADPGAEIAPGYGMATVTLTKGETVVGRLAEETEEHVVLIALDQSEQKLSRGEISAISPPVSAMPPMAAALSPRDFRDLIAFLASQNQAVAAPKGAAHGDDEKIAK